MDRRETLLREIIDLYEPTAIATAKKFYLDRQYYKCFQVYEELVEQAWRDRVIRALEYSDVRIFISCELFRNNTILEEV